MKNIYIHIGEGCVLKTPKIIGVFDTDTATVSKTTRDFLKNQEKWKKMENIFTDLPRSFVVTEDKTYMSSLNTSAIIRRTTKKKIF